MPDPATVVPIPVTTVPIESSTTAAGIISQSVDAQGNPLVDITVTTADGHGDVIELNQAQAMAIVEAIATVFGGGGS